MAIKGLMAPVYREYTAQRRTLTVLSFIWASLLVVAAIADGIIITRTVARLVDSNLDLPRFFTHALEIYGKAFLLAGGAIYCAVETVNGNRNFGFGALMVSLGQLCGTATVFILYGRYYKEILAQFLPSAITFVFAPALVSVVLLLIATFLPPFQSYYKAAAEKRAEIYRKKHGIKN